MRVILRPLRAVTRTSLRTAQCKSDYSGDNPPLPNSKRLSETGVSVKSELCDKNSVEAVELC